MCSLDVCVQCNSSKLLFFLGGSCSSAFWSASAGASSSSFFPCRSQGLQHLLKECLSWHTHTYIYNKCIYNIIYIYMYINVYYICHVIYTLFGVKCVQAHPKETGDFAPSFSVSFLSSPALLSRAQEAGSPGSTKLLPGPSHFVPQATSNLPWHPAFPSSMIASPSSSDSLLGNPFSLLCALAAW